MIVLDASLLIARLLDAHIAGLDGDIYDQLNTTQLIVPAHWPVEIANALRTNVRRGRITPTDFDFIAAFLAKLEVTISPPSSLESIAVLVRFAITHNLTAYDAAYVQVAMEQGAVLATVDADMRAAAKRFDIPLFPA